MQLRLACSRLSGDGTLGPPVCLVFKGWDASGKGGAIKRLVDPSTHATCACGLRGADRRRDAPPLSLALLARAARLGRHDGARPLLVRARAGEAVEGFAPEEAWPRAYGEIAEFERSLAAEGTVIVKFWLHVSPEEQLERFEAPARRPAQGVEAHRRGLAQPREARRPTRRRSRRCSTAPTSPDAPWILVEGDSKRWARVRVMDETIKAIEAGMHRVGVPVPDPLDDPSHLGAAPTIAHLPAPEARAGREQAGDDEREQAGPDAP